MVVNGMSGDSIEKKNVDCSKEAVGNECSRRNGGAKEPRKESKLKSVN